MTSDGSFSVVQGEMDGRPLIATINMGLCGYSEKPAVPWFLSISTPLRNPRPDGFPGQEDDSDLNEWEETVEKGLREEGPVVFVGRVTWNGHRELLYYISNASSSAKRIQRLIDEGSTRPFAFRCERDDKWEKVSIWLNR
jgi:hypothetical protein